MFFFRDLEKYSDRTALICSDGKKISYADLLFYADTLNKQLPSCSLVFLLCNNCYESVIGYVTCMIGDHTAAMLSSDIDGQMLKDLIDSYHPDFIWIPSERISEVSGTVDYSLGDYRLIKTNADRDYGINPDLKLLLTTSGSTGSPKFVRQTEDNIQSNTESIVEYLSIQRDDKAITTMPMNYTYGLSIINSHLFAGAAMILNSFTLMDKSFWDLIKEQEATTFGGVPYIYEMLKKLRFEKMNLTSLRYITQAGGKLQSELSDEFSKICSEKGMQFIIMYGQTEATARMAYRPWKYAFDKSESIGIAIPGGKFELVDENGRLIETEDTVGELIYHGKNVTMGYAQSRFDLDRGDENHGTLVTGDMAKRDSDGFYYIVGRKKRFLKLFGNRVNLDEVEQLLKKQNIEAVCAGVDDKMKIYITDSTMEKRVVDFIDNHTGISHSGYTISVIDEIPRSESGKILYTELK